MKKFLALALILTLALSVSVFAAEHTDRIVGKTGQVPQYDNGLTEAQFAMNDNPVNIAVNVTTGAYESRYAVDIEYDTIAFNVAGSTMVWDVDALKYVVKNAGTLSQPAAQTITVKNRSDKEVKLSASVSRIDTYAAAPLEVTATCSAPTINAATPGLTTETLPSATVSVALTADDWNAVANYFATILTPGVNLPIATVSLNITK